MNLIQKTKDLIHEQCQEGRKKDFYSVHLLEVERLMEELLSRYEDTEVDKQVCRLCVWLHDTQRVFDIKGDHQLKGAEKANEILKSFGVDDLIIQQVSDCIKVHSCNNDNLPQTLEGKLLATVDALSHFGDFYIWIATLGQRDIQQYKKFVNEKLDRDFYTKIFFDDVREEYREKYETIKKFINI